MKKTALLTICALLLGLAAGLLFNLERLGGRGLLLPGTGAASAGGISCSEPGETGGCLVPEDNRTLLEAGNAVLESLQWEDMEGLAALVDPDRGVTFTPYSTVDPHSDLTFLPQQLTQAGINESTYIWGITQGKGEAIVLTLSEYLRNYVFDRDYTKAPVIGVDYVISSGNSLENVDDAYPDARFVEYYFPGQDPEAAGLDWSALKLVFLEREETYWLIGIIHSEWTI